MRPDRHSTDHTTIPRFAETESVVILTMLLQRYKVELKIDPKYADETFEERKKRLMCGKPGITLACVSLSFSSSFAQSEHFLDRSQFHSPSRGGGEQRQRFLKQRETVNRVPQDTGYSARNTQHNVRRYISSLQSVVNVYK